MLKSIRTLALVSSVGALTFLPCSAQAQARGPSRNPSNVDAGTPIVAEGLSDFPVKAEISAGTEGKVASIKFNLNQVATVLAGNKATAQVDGNSFTLTVSTPWDGDTDAIPLGQDGLAGGTKLKLDYTLFASTRNVAATAEMLDIEAEATRLCIAKENTANQAAIVALGPNPGSAQLDARSAAHVKSLAACDIGTTDGATLVQTYLPSKNRRYSTGFFNKDILAFGIHGAVGFQKYGFVDPLTLAKGSEKHFGWSAGIGVTDYLRASPTAIWLNADYEEAYKEQDKQIFCPAASGPAPVLCVQDHAGHPDLEKSAIVKVGVRHRFLDSNGNGHFAIAPTASVDVLDGTWDASLPIYFIPGKDNSLTGGFVVGYNSEKKDATFGIFIGAAFGLSE